MELTVFKNPEETQKEIILSLERLFIEYETSLKKMKVFSNGSSEYSDVIGYFLQSSEVRYSHDQIFDYDKAKAVLNSKMWSEVIGMTNLLKYMPAEDRNKWNDSIYRKETPDFDRKTVIDTIRNLFSSQDLFFAKKVDGIFRNLSGEHLTNSPSGFNKRMILNNVFTSYDMVNSEKVAFIDDLRFVISKLIGLHHEDKSTYSDVYNMKENNLFGKWLPVDGGIFQMKLFKKGTIHLEIYPHLALKLNQVLALLYPTAIPSEHRVVNKKMKEFKLEKDFLSDSVLKALNDINIKLRRGSSTKFYFSSLKKETLDKVMEVIQLLDGVVVDNCISFSYNPKEILSEIIMKGQIPERKTHQFYPTEESLANLAQEMLGILERWDSILEPSAGNGRLLSQISKEHKVTCLDVSKVQCDVLKEKGYKEVLNIDFMKYDINNKFDKIIMNPPFTGNQAKKHVIKAISHLSEEGTLVAILPASLKNKLEIDEKEYRYEFSDIIENAFLDSNTKVSVCLLKVKKR